LAQMGSRMRIAAGAWTMSELARYQAGSLPTISKSVDMLVRRGWVERWVDKQDRRQTMARLTPSGRRMLAHIKERTERQVAQTLAPLTAAELTELVAALNVLARVLVVSGDAGCAPAQRHT